jgi:hypothetical protein
MCDSFPEQTTVCMGLGERETLPIGAARSPGSVIVARMLAGVRGMACTARVKKCDDAQILRGHGGCSSSCVRETADMARSGREPGQERAATGFFRRVYDSMQPDV